MGIASMLSVCAVMILALAGALLSFDFAQFFREERERRRIELQTSLDVVRNRDYQELQDLTQNLQGICDNLVSKMAVAASMRSSSAKGSPSIVAMPMLRLIQERTRVLC